MDVELPISNNLATTFDEVSLERSKSFVIALQELKNLRPQLYSAAEYWVHWLGVDDSSKTFSKEVRNLSTLNHSIARQWLASVFVLEIFLLSWIKFARVLDNLKDYAVQALVNAVDHLGTVAYKLTDLLEQQILEVSTMELQASCLHQQLHTCLVYTCKEGLRQHQVFAFIPKHHKHYILPNSVNKKVHFSPLVRTDSRQNYFEASRLEPFDSPAPKPLSCYLALETKPTSKGNSDTLASSGISKHSSNGSEIMEITQGQSLRQHLFLLRIHLFQHWVSHMGFRLVALLSDINSVIVAFHGCGKTLSSFQESEGPSMAFRSFDNRKRRIVGAPVRSKSLLPAFFVKQKVMKLKAGYVA
ncbi:protein ABIL1-like isoform X2 [Gossypium australe]|uniref:Protein ABIL1-like isoform X2 n=1 Tax=Gossypium australe TaxID=47621 RepID=A0A5B6UYA5_9ROSI|nr:protein ABIL1-like isoform X2 [Gossypium australe]